MEALLLLGILACPLGMLAMMGGMIWMSRRDGGEKAERASTPTNEAREVTHA